MTARKSRSSTVSPFVKTETTFMLCSSAITPSVDCAQTVVRINNASLPSWPDCSKLHCFHCHAAFDGPPAAVPTSYDHVRDAYVTYGTFCSWACALRFVLDNPNRLSCTAQMSAVWIGDLARRLGRKGAIRPAPPTAALLKYGGNMSLEEFREYASSGGPEIHHLQTPYLPFAEGLRGPFVPGQIRNIRRAKKIVPTANTPVESSRTAVGFYRKFLSQNASKPAKKRTCEARGKGQKRHKPTTLDHMFS